MLLKITINGTRLACLQGVSSITPLIMHFRSVTYKWLHDSCKKLMGDTANEHSIAKSNQKEALSTEIQRIASRIRHNDSLSVQLEAVRTNGICTMEMV
jgi:hypothetical protein